MDDEGEKGLHLFLFRLDDEGEKGLHFFWVRVRQQENARASSSFLFDRVGFGLASGWLRVEFVFIDRFTDAIGRCEPTQRMGGGGVVVQVGGGAGSPFGPITKNGEIVK